MADRDESVEVYRTWADQAWREQGGSDPGQCDSLAYTAGFKDGFVDYVYGGGSGEPPPVPPRPFWNVDIRNPRGHTEATDWFAGYRHGAQVAREEGYRKRTLVPLSMFLTGMSEEDANRNRADQPYYDQPYNQPVLAPITEIRQPEHVLPRPIQPEAIPNTSIEASELEQLPMVPASSKDRTENEAPENEAPEVDTPEIEAPLEEKLPQPPTETEDRPLPEQPGALENPPENTTPPADFDDIFGSSAQVRKPQILQRTSFERAIPKAIPKNISAQQARSAFASAIRNRSAIHNSSNNNSSSARASSPRHNTKHRPRRRGASARNPRPVAIPKSQDRAHEMFRGSTF